MVMALEGIKVIDIAQVAAVPMCARHLADFGADVIHIEHPIRGDSWRSHQAGHGGNSGIPSDFNYGFDVFNRNKRSVAIDLAQPGGQDIIYKLVENADVFVTNLRFWERDKFKMAYDHIKAINPKIIYGSVTGHGAKGPDRDRPAYDTTVYWSRGGLTHTLALPGLQGLNQRPAFGDVVAGLALAYGIVTALYAKDKYGIGQEVQTSLFETAIYQLTFDMAAALATRKDENNYRLDTFTGTAEEQEERKRLLMNVQDAMGRYMEFGRQRAPNPLANVYETKDGKELRFNCLLADKYWPQFCKITNRPELLDNPRFNSMEARKVNGKELYFILKKAFLGKTYKEWLPLLADIPWATAQNLVEITNDPQARANDFFVQVDHPIHGRIETLNTPIHMSATPATIRTLAPEFSQHTEEVLLEAGYTWENIIKFREQGVVG